MDDLIARLEAATEGSTALDEAIFEYVHGRERNISTFEQYDPSEPLPRYSRSIDAALTLVPEGHHWQMRSYKEKAEAVVAPHDTAFWNWDTGADAVTPALALCIAALKARLP